MLWRLLAPKPAKKMKRSVKKAAHPVSTTKRAVTPKPIKRATHSARSVAHPLEAAEQGAENAVVNAARGGKKRRPSKSGSQRPGPSTSRSYTPSNTPPSGVPILKEHTAFVAMEAERVAAEKELKEATDDRGVLVALVLIRELYDRQASLIATIAENVRLYNPERRGVDEFRAWTRVWLDEGERGFRRAADQVNHLADDIGEDKAQELIDQEVAPRLRRLS
jgi:hypothetical protein